MSYDPKLRQSSPDDEDIYAERIEIEFGIPAYINQDDFQTLAQLISKITRQPCNTPIGGVHRLSGTGSKPIFSQADCRFLGKPVDPNTPETGEPNFDDSILYFETCAKENITEE